MALLGCAELLAARSVKSLPPDQSAACHPELFMIG
jgi:hypothetical protein